MVVTMSDNRSCQREMKSGQKRQVFLLFSLKLKNSTFCKIILFYLPARPRSPQTCRPAAIVGGSGSGRFEHWLRDGWTQVK